MQEFSGHLRVSLDQSDQVGATLTVNLTMPSGRIVLALPSFTLELGQTVDLGLVIVTTDDADPAGWYEPPPGTIHRTATASVAVNPQPGS